MATHQLLRGKGKLGSVIIGGGTLIKTVKSGSVSIDPASIATVTRAASTFTLTGARAGDAIIMNPPTALNAGLIFVGATVTSNDTVSVYLYNTTVGAVDDTARTWIYTWIDLT